MHAGYKYIIKFTELGALHNHLNWGIVTYYTDLLVKQQEFRELIVRMSKPS